MSRRRRAGLGIAVLAAVGIALTALAAPPSELAGLRPSLDEGRDRLLSLLSAKEAALQRRAASLDAREAELKVAERQLQQRLDELEKLRAELDARLAQADAEREEEVRGLVKMFESMRDKQAAAILSKMDRDVALEILGRMNKGKAGKALAAMSPEVAARFADSLGAPPLAAGGGQ